MNAPSKDSAALVSIEPETLGTVNGGWGAWRAYAMARMAAAYAAPPPAYYYPYPAYGYYRYWR